MDRRLALPALVVAVLALEAFAPAGRPPDRTAPSPDQWLQWGGPTRDFIVATEGLADQWPETGPPVVWRRPLGVGHSAILVDEGRLYTMYRTGSPRGRAGPWDAEETVVALDAATGSTLWEHRYPSALLNFSFGAGPHATPLIVGDRLFTAGTNKQLHAFDKRTGRVLWSHDLVADFGAPPTLIRPAVKAGYGCSPLAWQDTIICSVGGAGQAVMAFRQADGAVAWTSGDFLVAEAAPILIDVGGQPQVVVMGGQTVNGLDPDSGHVLWSHPHDPGSDMNNSTPIWGNGILFVSSAYNAGSRALRLSREGEITRVRELWFTERLRLMFTNGLRLGDYIYGSDAAFGPSLVTAIHVETGAIAWQARGFGRSNFVHADGKAIVLDEGGELALVRLTPEGMTVLSRAPLFDTTAWTVPTLAGTTLYARDREAIVALDLAAPARGRP
ncbi:MAG TPA: PQQ-binding-like beta-propeller repeat protein [Vicinamibacterales bacterium]|nr:PQQ-binding-like beta-propeller repeat protein [Vicinamibacterales bacterium]